MSDRNLQLGNSQSQADWRKKGLGWVPDYPESEDFSLLEAQQSNLLEDEVNSNIETLARQFVEAINIFSRNIENPQLDQIKSKIQKKILGNVEFKDVKIHKRLQVRKTNLTKQEVIHLKFCFCLLSNTEIHRKKYTYRKFSILQNIYEHDFNLKEVHKEYRKDKKSNESFEDWLKKYDLEKFNTWLLNKRQGKDDEDYKSSMNRKREENNSKSFINWLSNESFHEDTENMVAAFQSLVSSQSSEIRVDGVVALQTYTIINQILKGETVVAPIEKLSVVYPIFPTNIFKVIREELISWLTVTKTWIEENKSKINNSQEIQEEIDTILETKKKISDRDFEQIFRDEFTLIEPIVSAIIQILSPLAQHQDKEKKEIVRQGMKSFRKGLEEFLDNFNPDDDILSLNPDETIHVKQVFRTLNLLEYHKKSSDHMQGKGINTSCFYDLVQHIFKKYKDQLEDCEEFKQFNLNNYYIDKEYLIELSKTSEGDRASEGDQDCGYFEPIHLKLPISRKALDQIEGKEGKSYFYLPSTVDLSLWCSPIRDQGEINSCAAFATVALLEYFIRRSNPSSSYTVFSPLFLYKAARNLMSVKEDTGSSVRETMRAMELFGVVPEKYWPYDENKCDDEPHTFCYSYAQNFQSLKYFRLDVPDNKKHHISYDLLLFQVKAVLAAGFPCIFGFTLYDSIYNDNQGNIPFPKKNQDNVVGGHVVVAVGYDDEKRSSVWKESGAILIRNSWGDKWGQKGYGWLPYSYVLEGLTADWWSLVKSEWLETGNFGLGAYNTGEENGGTGNTQNTGIDYTDSTQNGS